MARARRAARKAQDREIELAHVKGRYEFWTRLLCGWWSPLTVASLYIPIRAVQPIANALAGKHTTVSITISVTIVLSIALAGGVATLLKKNRTLTVEVSRLRKRLEDAGL